MINSDWLKIKEVFSQTLELPDAERARFLENYEEAVRAEVEKLLKFHHAAENFIETPFVIENELTHDAFAENLIGKRIGGYEIIEKIGEGGMGTVFLATRAERDFSRKAALKIIKRGMDTNAVLKRFLMERRILAALEHPFITRLLDGGATADGLPYFVMEYVEGTPITRFCGERDFGIKERLELFRKVCAAAAYSHQKLIVHGDLKPSNILITNDGTPKLLDFGIAKLLDYETDENTATRNRIFTPEYAAPEQIGGAPVSTATDVYSLGVVLYELLTGARPFQTKSRNYREISEQILTEEPLRPSSVISNSRFQIPDSEQNGDKFQTDESENQRPKTKSQKPKTKDQNPSTNPKPQISNPKSLRGDLDNIILKSLRKEAARRYQTVVEFSEDIRRYLDGLPVTATADSWSYRFSKFVKRHKIGAAAAAVILILSVFSVWQAVSATRERARAEERFEQVRKLANTVLFEYHDGIAALPGATAMREKMVSDSLEYLDNLAAEDSDNIELQREVVKAYRKVGDIQGGFDAGNTGKTQASLESYRKALKLQETIISANPENAEDQRFAGVLHFEIGTQQQLLGELQNAETSLLTALDIFSKQPAGFKKDSAIASVFWNIASLKTAQNELDASLENYQKALAIYEKLAVAEPVEKKHLRNAALTGKNIGSVLQLRGETEKALEYFRKSLAIDLENAKNNPNDVSAQLDLSFTYGTLASALRDAKKLEESLANIRAAIEVRERIFNADPKNAFAENALAMGYQQLGRTFLAAKNYAEAAREIGKSQKIYEKMAGSDAASSIKKTWLAENTALAGYVTGINGNFSKAAEFYENAFAVYSGLLSDGKLSPLDQRRFAAARIDFAEILLKEKQLAEALENLRQAETLLEKENVKKDAAEEIKRLAKLMTEVSGK